MATQRAIVENLFKRSKFALFLTVFVLITCSIPDIFTTSYDINFSARRTRDFSIQSFLQTQPSRNELLSNSQIEELKAIEGGKLIELNSNVVVAIEAIIDRENSEFALLADHLLPNRRILLKVDDRGGSTTYNVNGSAQVVSWMDFGSEGIVEDRECSATSSHGNDVFAYVHITEALYEQYKDNPAMLAQIVVREYKKRIIQDYILHPDYQTARANLLQSTEEAREKENLGALVNLLDGYDPTHDTLGVAKKELLAAILDVLGPEPIITSGEELMAWYRAEIEVGCKDVAELSDKIDDMIVGGRFTINGEVVTDIAQASGYVFSYTPTNPGVNKDTEVYHGGQPVYLPHVSYESGLSMEYSVNEDLIQRLKDTASEFKSQTATEDEAVGQLLDNILSSEIGSGTPLLEILVRDLQRIRQETPQGTRPQYSEYALHVNLDEIDPVVEFLERAVFANNLIMSIVDRVKTANPQRDGPFILSVIGPQGGGKSTCCQLLRIALRDADVNVDKLAIEKDMLARGFRYAPRFEYLLRMNDDTTRTVLENGEEMRGDGMYEWELIHAQLAAIREGQEVYNPDSKDRIDYSAVDVLIFDGPLTRHGMDLPGLIDFTVTLTEIESANRFSRRIARDVVHPGGKTDLESIAINDFAAKQFHQEFDIQRGDTLKADGSDVILRYGYDEADMLYYRDSSSFDIARYQVKQDILAQIQNVSSDDSVQFEAAEAQIVETLSGFITLLSSSEDDAVITANIRSLAGDFPIFSRGWLSQAMEGLDEINQGWITSAVEEIIAQTRLELQEPRRVVRVIPIGPAGTRGFPFSTQGEYGIPKALNDFGGKTNLTDSIERAGLGGKDVFMITTDEIVQKIRDAISGTYYDAPVLSQPSNANTLACVALTIAILAEEYGEDTVVSFMTTDHDFKDLDLLEKSLEDMEILAALEPTLSILGIKPTEPNTNMGHIIRSDGVTTFVDNTYVVDSFREKPPLEEAAQLNKQGALWNSGKGTGSISTWLRAFQEFAPDYYQKIQEIRETITKVKAENGSSALEALDDASVKAAIDEAYDYFGQHAAHYITVLNDPVPENSLSIGLGVVPYGSGWSDLGSLRGRWTNEVLDNNDNVVRAVKQENVTLDNVSGSNIILASGDTTIRIYVAGLKDIVVAYNDDIKTLVVVPILHDGNVKPIVNGLLDDSELRRFVQIDTPEIGLTSRVGISKEQSGTNTSYLANGGDVFMIESENVRVFAEGGLICGSNLSGITIIKFGDDIYVYGSDYQADADAKLKEVLDR
jgi:mannose-1-phosphate guanylyltransferase/uridine kinase